MLGQIVSLEMGEKPNIKVERTLGLGGSAADCGHHTDRISDADDVLRS